MLFPVATKNKKAIKALKKDLENLQIRFYIKQHIKNYDDNETYIIYNGNQIEIYNPEIFILKNDIDSFSSYYISPPIVSLCTR